MSPGISGTEKLEWDSFPGDIPGRHRRAHIVSVKQLSATVEARARFLGTFQNESCASQFTSEIYGGQSRLRRPVISPVLLRKPISFFESSLLAIVDLLQVLLDARIDLWPAVTPPKSGRSGMVQGGCYL
ncbi:hypothetical protein Tco_1017991 [Tanacetum coccineum]|uniref:Uncharacterized protein n=1 Tax=Tanacetum coccineum TaxID=301880 RepID=A0ABQ5FT42_9ASTR